jgi:hypothetical protein
VLGRKILPIRFHTLYHVNLLALLAILTIMGSNKLIPILNPITFFFREADKNALNWIEAHISPNETILINPFLWNNGVYAGQDGGYWITPTAGRKTIPPPVLYAYKDPHEIYQINQLCRKVIDNGKKPDELYAFMQSEGIEYIYIGARGGVLSPQELKESRLFQLIYELNGIWIFKTQ